MSDKPRGMDDGLGRMRRADRIEPRGIENVAVDETRRGARIT